MQLMALGIVPDDPDSVAKAFVDLKTELDKEKTARIAAQIKMDMLTQVVKDQKMLANSLPLKSPLSKTRLNT
jgi:hypothetical protein